MLLSMALSSTCVQHVGMLITLLELGELPLPADKVAFLLLPFTASGCHTVEDAMCIGPWTTCKVA